MTTATRPEGADPTPLTYRIATEADVGPLVELVQSAYRGELSRTGWTTEADLLDGQRVDAPMIADFLAVPGQVMIIGERDATTIACCQLERHGPIARFGMFAVRPDRQGGGIGRSMLAHAEEFAVQRWRAETIRLTVISVRDDLIAWYERRGYRRTGELLPFPYGDERFGLPRRNDLAFAVLTKPVP